MIKTQSDNNQPKGFALIATISVMVLLVMIALAMLSLSTIELRASKNGQAILRLFLHRQVVLSFVLPLQ